MFSKTLIEIVNYFQISEGADLFLERFASCSYINLRFFHPNEYLSFCNSEMQMKIELAPSFRSLITKKISMTRLERSFFAYFWWELL